MAINSEAILNQKYFEMIKLLNIYLNHFPRHEKFALSNNIRNTAYEIYDFVLIGLTLAEAKKAKELCERFVQDKLNLELSHWHIQKIKRGINFVGYRTWKRIKFVRKHSMYKMKKAIKKIKIESIVSLVGHAKRTATTTLYRRLLIEFDILKLLPIGVQKCLSI